MVATAALAVVAAAATHPVPALATSECSAFTSTCVSVPGPWVAVPAESSGAPGFAGWSLECNPPNPIYALGFDISRGSPPPLVAAVDPTFGSGPAPFGQAFVALNVAQTATSFQPVIGCISPSTPPVPPPGASAGGRNPAFRIAETPLAPRRDARYRRACRGGERLVRSRTGVGFFKRRPPSAQELRELHVTRRLVRGRLEVHVVTGPHTGDDERLRLQTQLVCHATG